MTPIQRASHWELHRTEDERDEARAERDRYRAALEKVRDYEEMFLSGPPDDEMRDIAREALK